MSEDPKLLPCPFCGEGLFVSNSGLAIHQGQSQSTCMIGSVGIPIDHQPSIDKWNTRTDHVQTLIAAEREAIASLCEGLLPPDGWASSRGDVVCEAYCEAGQDLAKTIHARTTANAQAALDARDKRVRGEALRDAGNRLLELNQPAHAETVFALINADD